MEGSQIHISLAPEILGSLGALSVTNTLILGLLTTVLLAIGVILYSKKISLLPSRTQTTLELVVGGVSDYVEEVLESRALARKFLPLLLSIFIFVLLLNWIQFIPGVGSIGFYSPDHKEFMPIFRGTSTDLNFTLALALIAFITIEYTGISELGTLKYLGKFFNFKSPLVFAVGIIDLFSEVARLISFSFRLFGNIFAGEVILAIVIFFTPYIAPVPFLGFEIFVGLIQASIFALLTLFFMKIAKSEPH